MYSGSTITNFSGNIVGAHQKINRIARKHLFAFGIKADQFPTTAQILRFEGNNGPDSAKSKLDGEHAPWHFYDPFDPDDGQLQDQLREHYDHLIDSLRLGNVQRAAFDAAWLAHALVDGLTPAHHYPYEEKLEQLRGEGKETRNTIFKKVFIPGEGLLNLVRNNWAMWGAKGLFTSHALFEFGSAMVFAPLNRSTGAPTQYDIKRAENIGLEKYFAQIAREIALMNMYDRFCHHGWTPKLANDIRRELAPRMVRTVAVAWYMALNEAKS